MARDVFANRTVGMLGQSTQGLRISTRMLADQPKQIVIRFRGLLDQFFEHLRLCIGAQDQTNFFIPGRINVIQFARASVDQFFERAALLLTASDRQIRSFKRIKNAQQVLAFAKNDLRSAHDSALFFFFVLHQVRTSHVYPAPLASTEKCIESLVSLVIQRGLRNLVELREYNRDYVPRTGCGKVAWKRVVPDVQRPFGRDFGRYVRIRRAQRRVGSLRADVWEGSRTAGSVAGSRDE